MERRIQHEALALRRMTRRLKNLESHVPDFEYVASGCRSAVSEIKTVAVDYLAAGKGLKFTRTDQVIFVPVSLKNIHYPAAVAIGNLNIRINIPFWVDNKSFTAIANDIRNVGKTF